MRTIIHLVLVFLVLPAVLIVTGAPKILFVPIAFGYFELARKHEGGETKDVTTN